MQQRLSRLYFLLNGKAKYFFLRGDDELVQSFTLSVCLNSGLLRLLVKGSVRVSLYLLNHRAWYNQSWIKIWSPVF